MATHQINKQCQGRSDEQCQGRSDKQCQGRLIEIIPDKVYLLKNILTPEECKRYIDYINECEIDQSKRLPCKIYNPRYVDHLKNEQLAQEFWEKLNTIVPQFYKGRPLKRVSDIVPVAKYRHPKSEGTTIHTDTIHVDDIVYAVVLYLNDDFEGGETSIYSDDDELLIKNNAKKGDGIIFHISMRHRGHPTVGEKYIIRPRLCYKMNHPGHHN